jgi:hypothetical protein
MIELNLHFAIRFEGAMHKYLSLYLAVAEACDSYDKAVLYLFSVSNSEAPSHTRYDTSKEITVATSKQVFAVEHGLISDGEKTTVTGNHSSNFTLIRVVDVFNCLISLF